MKKEMIVPELDGIVISDPWYEKGVWCRYESDVKGKDWKMEMNTEIVEDEEYEMFSSIDFTMKLALPSLAPYISIGKESIRYPQSLQMKEYDIGMDTACSCCGSQKNYEMLGESMAIRTGTDGLLGTVYEFRSGKTNEVCAVVFMGSIDAEMINPNELTAEFCAGFDAVELEKDLDKVIADAEKNEGQNPQKQSHKNKDKER